MLLVSLWCEANRAEFLLVNLLKISSNKSPELRCLFTERKLRRELKRFAAFLNWYMDGDWRRDVAASYPSIQINQESIGIFSGIKPCTSRFIRMLVVDFSLDWHLEEFPFHARVVSSRLIQMERREVRLVDPHHVPSFHICSTSRFFYPRGILCLRKIHSFTTMAL